MVSKEELKQIPKYKKAKAIEKIAMENHYLPEAAKYREIPEAILGTIGAIGGPILLNYLSKKGIIANQNPNCFHYLLSSIVGFTGGYSLGLVFGTLAYETFSKEGDINKFFLNCKKHLSKKDEE